MVLRILHPILASTLCTANPLARIAEPHDSLVAMERCLDFAPFAVARFCVPLSVLALFTVGDVSASLAESRVFHAAGWLPTPGLRVASDRPNGGAHGWLKSAAGRAAGSELRTRKSLIRLDFIEHKSERSVMPQDTGVGRNVVLDDLDFASLRRVWEQAFGAAPPRSLSRVFLRRVLLHERQCRTHGGLSAASRRALAAMANETPSSGAPAGSVSAGTHLVTRVSPAR